MKKIVSILLAVLLVASAIVSVSAYSVTTDTKTVADAVAEYEELAGESVPTWRYYFQMPTGKNGPLATEAVYFPETDEETGEVHDVLVCNAGEHAPTWLNSFNYDPITKTCLVGIYFWDCAAGCESWAGYQGMVEDAEHFIYYADVPQEAVTHIWNNSVDGGLDKTDPIYYYAQQTINIACEYPDPGEYDTIPDGADSFDGMIFIINPDKVDVQPDNHKQTCGGDWYFYYGNGCYGSYAEGKGDNTCLNPDHYVDGQHVGWHGDVEVEVSTLAPSTDDPTEEPTTEVPTSEPSTEDPTELPTTPEPSEYLRGDYDGDGEITILDATKAQRVLAELDPRDDDFLAKVDADGDGELQIVDATRIQCFIAELMNMDGSKPYVKPV